MVVEGLEAAREEDGRNVAFVATNRVPGVRPLFSGDGGGGCQLSLEKKNLIIVANTGRVGCICDFSVHRLFPRKHSCFISTNPQPAGIGENNK